MEENKICDKCGKIIENDDYFEYQGNIYCKDCEVENFFICDICENIVSNDEICYTEDSPIPICESCLNNYCTKCVDCGTYHNNQSMTLINNHGLVCNMCLSDYYVCDDCGDWFDTNDLTEFDEGYYCNDCYAEFEENIFIKEYHYHHNNEPIFFGNNNCNDVPYLGIELEVDRGVDADDCAKEITNILPTNFIYMEHDGSLNDGFEIITQPATFEYHYFIEDEYRKMSKILLDYGFRSHDTITCGLHVHFNRDFFSSNVSQEEYHLRIMRLLYLVEKFWVEFSKFSRRSLSSLKRWADKYEDSPQEIVKDMENLDRYRAINLTNKNTIEFRLFKGTLKIDTFMATLEMCNNLVKISKNTDNIKDLQAIKWEDLLISENLKNYWETVKYREVE